MEIIEKLAKEFHVIRQTPLSFFLITLVIAGGLWALFGWWYGDRLTRSKELMDYYKEKSSFGSLSESETSKLKKDWDSTPVVRVTGKQFINETIPLDGFHYDHCTFDNVNLEYNGDKTFGLTYNKFKGNIVIKTKNPAIKEFLAALQNLGFFRADLQLL